MKLAGVVVTEGLCKLHNISYTIVRPSAVYGPKDMNRRVSQIFIENAINNREITINGSGDERLDFTYIQDLIHGVKNVIESDNSKNEIFNINFGN